MQSFFRRVFLFLALLVFAETTVCQIEGDLQRHVIDSNAIVYFANLTNGELVFTNNLEYLRNSSIPIGSLIKPFTLYFALSRGLIDENTVFFCPRTEPDDPDHSRCWYTPGHGRLSSVEALSKSCNIYFLRLAERIKYQEFILFMESAGIEVDDLKMVEDRVERKKIITGISTALRINPLKLIENLASLVRCGIYGSRFEDSISLKKQINSCGIVMKGMRYGVLTGTSSPDDESIIQTLTIFSKTGTTGRLLDFTKDKIHKNSGFYFGFILFRESEYVVFILLPDGKGHDAALSAKSLIDSYFEKISLSGH